MIVGYLLLISCNVDDPGEAWRSLWTFYWTLIRLLTISITTNSILRNTTAIKSLSCKLTSSEYCVKFMCLFRVLIVVEIVAIEAPPIVVVEVTVTD